MKQILVLGAGRVGQAMARDLSRSFSVTVADIDPENLKPLVGITETFKGDLGDPTLLAELVGHVDLVLGALPGMKDLAHRWEEHMKGMLIPGTLFEELGFNYIGPIDGHDLPVLVRTLRTIQKVDGPNLMHIITAKGKGYAPAEPVFSGVASPETRGSAMSTTALITSDI